jgi:hypothetical protein
MKRNRMDQGRLSERGKGLGTVTEKMVRNRAQEIAMINGRDRNHVLDADLEQARRDLLGEETLNPIPPAEERLPEGERWDPVPGSPGHKAPTVSASDEQTIAEDLVEEGIADAEFEQELEAARAAAGAGTKRESVWRYGDQKNPDANFANWRESGVRTCRKTTCPRWMVGRATPCAPFCCNKVAAVTYQ